MTLKVALAGNPNVGKSTIFNILTGLHQHVGNWPGKTVEKKEGHFRWGQHVLHIVDLPGTYGLSGNSPEEVVARDFILLEKPDAVIVIADAFSIERSLYLLAEVTELTDRVVLALNMMDTAEQNGVKIDVAALSETLGLPVVPTVATRTEGLPQLAATAAAVGTGQMTPKPKPVDHSAVAEPLKAIADALAQRKLDGYPARWVAMKLLEGDEDIRLLVGRAAPDLVDEIDAVRRANEQAPALIAHARYDWIEQATAQAVARPAASVISLADRLDHILTHRIVGLPILVAIFAVVFWFTFSIARPVGDAIDSGAAALGQVMKRSLSGQPFLAGLLGDGVLPGLGGVVALFPVILVFFFFLGLLEQSGYMARAAFVMDRIMHAVGLHGKAFLTFLVGYGCNVPAIMGTRILESQRERRLAILLNPLIPCAPRIAVAAFFTAAFFPPHVRAPFMISLYVVSLCAIIGAGFVLGRLLPGEPTPLMMELPLYRKPNIRGLGIFLWWRLRAFVRKAGTVIVSVAVLVWLLSSFPAGSDLPQTYLGRLGKTVEPATILIGFDWKMAVALITAVTAKENSLATLAILYHSEGEKLAHTLAESVPAASAVAFIVFQLLYVPCLPTLAVMRAELGSLKFTLLGVAYTLVLATIIAAAAYYGASALGL